MAWYVARRFAWAILATLLVLSVTFGLLAASPNAGAMEAAFQAAASDQNPEEAMEQYKQRRGLDRPIEDRYVEYMTNMVTFNWGWSTTRGEPVVDAITDAWPYSVMVVLPSTILAIVFGILIGLYSAMNQYTKKDYAATFGAFFGISIPNFWFAIMLALIFAVWMRDLVVLGYPLRPLAPPVFYHTNVPWFSLANLHQLVLPILVVSTATVASQMRYARAQALEYMEQEFVKTARAKGADDWQVLLRHILRPAMVPLSTILIAEVIGVLWAGALVVEVVFQIPGIGLLAFKAISNQDTALLLVAIMIPAFLTIMANLAQDLAYTWLDPRIDYGDR